MKLRPPTTDADRRAEEVYHEILRSKTGWERICMASDLFESLKDVCKSGIRAQRPDWGEEQVDAEFKRRLR